MKKIISAFLVLALCLSFAPLALAEEWTPADNTYFVCYDEADGAAVELQGSGSPALLNNIDWGNMTPSFGFTPGQALSFLLTPPAPEGQSAGKPYRVEAVSMVNPQTVQNLTGSVAGTEVPYSLEYTPASSDCFFLRIWWTEEEYEYDQCQAEVGQILVEFSEEGYGKASYDALQTSIAKQKQYRNMSRVVLAAGTESFTLEAVPKENLLGIWVEQDVSQDVDLSVDSRYEDGTFTLSFAGDAYDNDQQNGKFVNLRFDFSNGEPQENQYLIRYADTGSVADIASEDLQSFTAGAPLTWTLTYPTDVTALCRVEINVLADPGAHYEYNDGDTAHNSSEITVDNNAKTISFTPDSSDPFEVSIYWTAQDVFDNFGFNDGDEFQIRTNVSGAGTLSFDKVSDRGQYQLDEHSKYNFAVTNLPLTVTFTPDADETLDILVLGETTYSADSAHTVSELLDGGVYTFTIDEDMVKHSGETRYKDFYMEAHFSENTTPPTPPSGVSYEALRDGLQDYIFAYSGATAAEIKTVMANELSERRIGSEAEIGTNEYALGEILGKNVDELLDVITLGALVNDTDNALGKPYYPYTIQLNGDISAYGGVYVLDNDTDVVLMTQKGGETNYSIVTLPENTEENAFKTTYLYADCDFYTIFGNRVWLNGIESEDGLIDGYHVTAEHAGSLPDSFPLGCRLLVFKTLQSVNLDYSKDAAAWSFINSNAYSTGTADAPANASVFYGADEIQFAAAPFLNFDGQPTLTGVEVLNLSEDAVSIEGTSLTFLTDYDYAELKFTYSNGTVGYLNLTRVGLVIDSTGADGAPDAEHYHDDLTAQTAGYETNFGAGSKTFLVWHGSDQSVRYLADSTAEKVVTGTFYYDSETVPADTVNLYVTIRFADGSTQRRIITEAITDSTARKATAVDNGGFITDDNGILGYAGQGSCHYYDDFILWSGGEAAFRSIESISAIVFTPGTDEDTFGGIKVGSGTGVEWING